jgi:hypothetical protein
VVLPVNICLSLRLRNCENFIQTRPAARTNAYGSHTGFVRAQPTIMRMPGM